MVSDDASNDSSKMNRHLELIDDEALLYGVKMVKIDDPLMSKKYGHRQPPGLGLFRKGDYIKFEGCSSKDIWPGRHKVKFDPFLHAGDLFDEEEMLEWVTDPNVMEVSDQIERVNKKMLEKLLKRNEFLAVFFCK